MWRDALTITSRARRGMEIVLPGPNNNPYNWEEWV
jgi:hypothetical protein